jgi:hypothetical protein
MVRISTIVVAAALTFPLGTVEAAPADVNCNTEAIASVIATLPPGPAVPTIQQTCVEDLLIIRDDLTLNGKLGVGGTVEGTITIDSASGIVVEDLVVRDATGNGIDITDASSVEIRETEVSDIDGECEIFASNASFLKIVESEITGPVSPIPEQYGLCVGSGSVVRGEGNTITGLPYGVSLFQHGTYIGKDETIDGPTLAAKATSSSFLQFSNAGDESTLNGDVLIIRLSHGYLRKTQVNGIIHVWGMS